MLIKDEMVKFCSALDTGGTLFIKQPIKIWPKSSVTFVSLQFMEITEIK